MDTTTLRPSGTNRRTASKLRLLPDPDIEPPRIVALHVTEQELLRWNLAANDAFEIMEDFARRVIEAATVNPPLIHDLPPTRPRGSARMIVEIDGQAWNRALTVAEALDLDVHEWARRVLLAFLAGG